MFESLIKGMIIGVSIAAPVGPVGILCIRRTVEQGRRVGFLSGLGAATADGLYGLVAAFGLSALMTTLIDQQFWLQVCGSIFIIYLGIQSLRSTAADRPAEVNAGSAYVSTLLLTLTNPMTILSFIAIFSGTAVTASLNEQLTIVAGVFLGSASWWLLLSQLASILLTSSRVSLTFINRTAGVLLIIFGLYNLMKVMIL